MKIAIHNGSGWNQKWIQYCELNNVDYITVNCYDTNIVSILKQEGATHLMWYFHHNSPTDILMARNVLFSATKMGLKTFPDFDTCWHFDDKVSQKYLLESVDAKMVPTHVFYNKEAANNWLKESASFPLVAKLRRGAGSYNVILLKNLREAKQYTGKMFGKGIHPSPGYIADVKNKLKVAGNIEGIKKRLKKAPNYFKMVLAGKKGFPKEKGYIYFQDFVEGNIEDLRIAVIDNHIWGFKRKVRDGDFRASGSGMVYYDLSDVSIDLIKELHSLSKLIGAQSIAFDLVKKEDEYIIVEISYGFVESLLYDSPGYWDENYNFIKERIWPDTVIIEKFINS